MNSTQIIIEFISDIIRDRLCKRKRLIILAGRESAKIENIYYIILNDVIMKMNKIKGKWK